MIYAIAIGLITMICSFCYYSNSYVMTTCYKITLNVKSSFRIIHLSDLHSKQYGKCNGRLYRKIQALHPDIIVFTGDLIDDTSKNMEITLDFMGTLADICPVYYIFGNHEHRTEHLEHIAHRLESAGIHVLQNEIERTRVKGNKVAILGLDENQASKKNYRERRKGTFIYDDNSAYFRELETCEGIKIVLSHYPENFDSEKGYSYKRYNYDVQFSGHAHGGQFRLPFFGGVFSPGQGIHPKYYYGIHGDRPFMIISRGLGNSGFPLRLFNNPHIIVADID